MRGVKHYIPVLLLGSEAFLRGTGGETLGVWAYLDVALHAVTCVHGGSLHGIVVSREIVTFFARNLRVSVHGNRKT